MFPKKQFSINKRFRLFTFIISSIYCVTITQLSAETVRGTGSAMEFDIGYGIMINEGSSILREWVYVNDDRLPVKISKFEGLEIELEDRSWYYRTAYTVEIDEPVVAFTVRIIPFNVWGEKDRVLAGTEIKDYQGGSHQIESQWRIISENDAVEHFASLAYVTQVRLSSGKILRSDSLPILDEARRFSEDFSTDDLVNEED